MDNYQIRKELYDAASLYAGFDPDDESSYASCYDGHVYADFIANGKRSRDLAVTLPRTLHDHSISDALYRFLHRGKHAREDERVEQGIGGEGAQGESEDQGVYPLKSFHSDPFRS